jgi:hypothetical protein
MTKNKLFRNLPYPYKGALSLSSDPDFQDFEFFEEFNKFLNTDLHTKFGYGLGLEITSGIFFYTRNTYNFSYLDENHKETQFAERLKNYTRTGWIDTNHAYGDFDHYGGFKREMALNVCELLNSMNVKLSVFTNHGDSYNTQNIGKNYNNYKGDQEGTQEYHTDLLMQTGCEFVWDQSMVLEQNSFPKKFFIDEPVKQNSLLKGFFRLRGTGYHAPNLSSLPYQISLIDFDRMYKNGETIIIYQHFGVLSRYAKHCEIASINAVKSNRNLLSGFYKIAEETSKGSLWVCGTGRLLRYIKMIDSISISEISYNNFIISSPINVDLSGLTLYADTRDPVNIFYKGDCIPVIYNGPDETGRYSVTVPFKKLECIW